MNKKIGKKYLRMVAEDSAYYVGATSAAERAAAQARSHKCTATKRPCPLKVESTPEVVQGEFDLSALDPNGAKTYKKYLDDYWMWISGVDNPQVIQDQFRKHHDNHDMIRLLQIRSDQLHSKRDQMTRSFFGGSL